MNWSPEVLVKRHTQRGQWVEVTDTTLIGDGRRIITITVGSQTLELDVERDAGLAERIANGIYKVRGDVRQAVKAREAAAAKAAINAEASAA